MNNNNEEEIKAAYRKLFEEICSDELIRQNMLEWYRQYFLYGEFFERIYLPSKKIPPYINDTTGFEV